MTRHGRASMLHGCSAEHCSAPRFDPRLSRFHRAYSGQGTKLEPERSFESHRT